MTASMLNGDDKVCGTMTSGGTESLLMACKVYRDKALQERGVTEPEMLASHFTSQMVVLTSSNM